MAVTIIMIKERKIVDSPFVVSPWCIHTALNTWALYYFSYLPNTVNLHGTSKSRTLVIGVKRLNSFDLWTDLSYEHVIKLEFNHQSSWVSIGFNENVELITLLWISSLVFANLCIYNEMILTNDNATLSNICALEHAFNISALTVNELKVGGMFRDLKPQNQKPMFRDSKGRYHPICSPKF